MPTLYLPRRTRNAVTAAWRQTVAHWLQANFPSDNALADAATAARRAMNRAAFVALCRQRGMEPPEGTQHAEPVLALDGLPLEAAPELLGEIHQHLLACRLERSADGRLQAVQSLAGRKASGVFYTPGPLRECLVDASLGKKLAEHGAAIGLEGCRVLDPACGGGWVLLSAGRRLLEWCQRQNLPDPHAWVARQLHGIDVDAEAVQVARRALWLELAAAAADRELVCGILKENVRCGDALAAESPMAGPFDVVLGNPPHHRELGHRAALERVADTPLGRRYRCPRMDLWYYFVHRGLELLRPGGRLALIVGGYWTASRGAERLRQTLAAAAHVDEIVCFESTRTFRHVAGRQMLLAVTNRPGGGPTCIKRIPSDAMRSDGDMAAAIAAARVLTKHPEELFRDGRMDLEATCDAWLPALERYPALGTFGAIRQGIAENPATVTRAALAEFQGAWTAGEGVFSLSPAEVESLQLPPEEQALLRPYHDLCDLGRYRLAAEPSRRLIYATAATWPDLSAFPTLAAHLARFRPILEARRETRRGVRGWWQLHWPRAAHLWQADKLAVLQMAPRPACVAAHGPLYVPFSVNVFQPRAGVRERLEYFSALLNSRLLWAWFAQRAKRRGVGLEINGHVLAAAPIRPIAWDDARDRCRHEELVKRVQRRMQVANGNGPEAMQCEGHIDRIVEELYALGVTEQAEGNVCGDGEE